MAERHDAESGGAGVRHLGGADAAGRAALAARAEDDQVAGKKEARVADGIGGERDQPHSGVETARVALIDRIYTLGLLTAKGRYQEIQEAVDELILAVTEDVIRRLNLLRAKAAREADPRRGA